MIHQTLDNLQNLSLVLQARQMGEISGVSLREKDPGQVLFAPRNHCHIPR